MKINNLKDLPEVQPNIDLLNSLIGEEREFSIFELLRYSIPFNILVSFSIVIFYFNIFLPNLTFNNLNTKEITVEIGQININMDDKFYLYDLKTQKRTELKPISKVGNLYNFRVQNGTYLLSITDKDKTLASDVIKVFEDNTKFIFY